MTVDAQMLTGSIADPSSASGGDPVRVTDFSVGATGSAAVAELEEALYCGRTALPPWLAGGWHVYLHTPLARLFERRPAAVDGTCGISAMLVVPAGDLEQFRSAGTSVFGGPSVSVPGVATPPRARFGELAAPGLFTFRSAALRTSWRPPRDRQWLAMSLPLLLPGWVTVPATDIHAGWSGLCGSGGSLAHWLWRVVRQTRVEL